MRDSFAKGVVFGAMLLGVACGSDGASGDSGPSPVDAATADAPGAIPDAAPPDAAALTYASCFDDVFAMSSPITLDLDQFGPTIGSHCMGTNHQDITGVERVVFVGDSVTVGTPPTLSNSFYRSLLADSFVARFGLAAPSTLWKQVNVVDGVALLQNSGDFASCAKWGAKTDDLVTDNTQIEDCIPPSERGKRTLIVMTVGGNDLASIAKDGSDGVPPAVLWPEVEAVIADLEAAVEWVRTPGRFPNGAYILFANMFEFTDGTGDAEACPAAALAGFGAEWDDPQALVDMVVWMNEQYMRIAVDHQADMVFMLETFCGHGFNNDNPAAPCYRGPGTPRWFDDTCTHPNPAGHGVIRDLFDAVVAE